MHLRNKTSALDEGFLGEFWSRAEVAVVGSGGAYIPTEPSTKAIARIPKQDKLVCIIKAWWLAPLVIKQSLFYWLFPAANKANCEIRKLRSIYCNSHDVTYRFHEAYVWTWLTRSSPSSFAPPRGHHRTTVASLAKASKILNRGIWSGFRSSCGRLVVAFDVFISAFAFLVVSLDHRPGRAGQPRMSGSIIGMLQICTLPLVAIPRLRISLGGIKPGSSDMVEIAR